MPTTAVATSAGGARRRPPSRLVTAVQAVALVLLAALVTFPTLVPGGPAGLRTVEFVGVAANSALALALLSGAALHRAAVPIAIAALLSIPWIWAEVVSISMLTTDNPARFALVRWVMGIATGYWLAVLMDDDRWRRTVGAGLVLGLLLSLASVVHDAATFDISHLALLTPEEQKTFSYRWVGDEYRAAGTFGHPNNAAAIILLIVPLTIGLVEERRLPRAAIVIAVFAIGATFFITKTRGPTIISVALLALHLCRGSPMRKVIALMVLALALVVAAVGGVFPAGDGDNLLVQRFTDTDYAAENLDGRLLTTLAALEIALTHPLGVGSSYMDMLAEMTSGFTATHNAYAQLALMGGLPLALFTTVRLLANCSPPASRARMTEFWVAVYVAGAFMFENLFFAPTFAIFTVWLLWRPPSRAAVWNAAWGAVRPAGRGPGSGRGVFGPGPAGPIGGAKVPLDRLPSAQRGPAAAAPRPSRPGAP